LVVHFVYRTPYAGPTGKHIRRLEADSILDWFRRVWNLASRGDDEDEWTLSARDWVKAEFGHDVYGLWSIFAAAREFALPTPETDDRLAEYLSKYLGVESSVLVSPHAIQAWTNDDEMELAYYFFDDAFARDHPGRTAFLLHEDWRLPVASGSRPFATGIALPALRPGGDGSGATYLVFRNPGVQLFEEFWRDPPRRIEGVRLPDLRDYLLHAKPDTEWPIELRLLRLTACQPRLRRPWLLEALDEANRTPLGFLKQDMTSVVHTIVKDALPDRPLLGPVDEARAQLDAYRQSVLNRRRPSRRWSRQEPIDLVAIDEHIAQFGFYPGGGTYHQWILFDDLWAGEHEHLAQSLLRFESRWDVLSEDQVDRPTLPAGTDSM
jgi:hypothetical protein